MVVRVEPRRGGELHGPVAKVAYSSCWANGVCAWLSRATIDSARSDRLSTSALRSAWPSRLVVTSATI